MPDCNYCEESFADEETYLKHLHEAHDESELSSIDKRRVEQQVGGGGDDEGIAIGPIVIGGVILLTVGVIAYVLFFLGGSGGGQAGLPDAVDDVEKTPYGLQSVHEHGTINVTIAGEELDFSQDRYQLQADPFHFENRDGTTWHKHAQGVTLEYAMATLGIEVTEDTVTFEGTTYKDSNPGETVIVEVNGESVDPETYVLQGASADGSARGDRIRIVVRTNDTG